MPQNNNLKKFEKEMPTLLPISLFFLKIFYCRKNNCRKKIKNLTNQDFSFNAFKKKILND
jgi:hypothetical protein